MSKDILQEISTRLEDLMGLFNVAAFERGYVEIPEFREAGDLVSAASDSLEIAIGAFDHIAALSDDQEVG